MRHFQANDPNGGQKVKRKIETLKVRPAVRGFDLHARLVSSQLLKTIK
jgi:hypothetical protein